MEPSATSRTLRIIFGVPLALLGAAFVLAAWHSTLRAARWSWLLVETDALLLLLGVPAVVIGWRFMNDRPILGVGYKIAIALVLLLVLGELRLVMVGKMTWSEVASGLPSTGLLIWLFYQGMKQNERRRRGDPGEPTRRDEPLAFEAKSAGE